MLVIFLFIAFINESYCLFLKKTILEVDLEATSYAFVVLPLIGAFLVKWFQNTMLEMLCKLQEDEKQFLDNDLNVIPKDLKQLKLSIGDMSPGKISVDRDS